MALKVWYEDDVRNILSGIAQAGDLLPNADSPEDMAYVRGFNAALNILYTSFGIGTGRVETITVEGKRPTKPSTKYLVSPAKE